MPERAIIFANGAVERGFFVEQVLQDTTDALIVAADGGARMAKETFDLTPDIVIGDMDSISPTLLETLQASGVRIQRHPSEKNETDLELALLWVVQQEVQHIRIIGALGRRIDQTFGNVYLLALPQLAAHDIRIVSGTQQMWLVAPGIEHTLAGEAGDTVSLIPISGDVVGISTENLYYPLNDETLQFGPARGMSNVLTAPEAKISLKEGLLLVVHTRGEAQ